MRALVIALLLILILPISQLSAYTADELGREFDARQLTEQEKRFLQVGLAFANLYNGMIDGAWGKASQSALERYTLANGGTSIVTNADALFAALDAYEVLDGEGWERQYNSALDMSFLIPTAALIDGAPSDVFVNLNVRGRSIGYSMTIDNGRAAQGYHEYTANRAIGQVYTVRRPLLWITSARTSGGISLYTRSDYRGGSWSTLMIAGDDGDAGAFAAITGSIAPGYAPGIGISSGRLATGIETLARIMDERDTPDPAPPAGVPHSGGEAVAAAGSPAVGFGTGFFVSEDGYLLTNQHVVSGCASLSVDGSPATVVAEDTVFDLALLRVNVLSDTTTASFAADPARLNSDVTVAGYPLPDLLGGLNVTRGSVTSLKGMGGDGINMQISAPVQPGNSGGPVLNATGQVVGVVVAKLDIAYALKEYDDIPQNVNFAIRGEIAKLFLAQNGVNPVISPAGVVVPPEELAEVASGFTRLITCR